MQDLTILFGDDAELKARHRTFKSGSRGFGAYGKISIDGLRYQVSCNVIEVGSKLASPEVPEVTDDE